MLEVTRNVVVHYHIFKNAGSTIDHILDSNFPGSVAHFEGSLPWGTLNSDQLAQFVIDHPQVRAIASHHARLPLPALPDTRILPILFIRHPIDRVESVYRFERKQDRDSLSPSVVVAQDNDLKGFVEWGLSDSGTAVFRDFQVVHLAGRETDMRFARANPADLDIACARLRELPFVGVVDRFSPSIEALARYLSPYAPSFTANEIAINVSEDRATALSERLLSVRHQIGDALYSRLLQENAGDMKLYEIALRRYD